MLSWIFGIMTVLLLVVLVLTIKMLREEERGSRRHHERIMELQEKIGEAHRYGIQKAQEAADLREQLETTKEALQDSKSRFGLVKKNLKNTMEALRGKNFRSKKESLEHSKPFKQLMKMLERL